MNARVRTWVWVGLAVASVLGTTAGWADDSAQDAQALAAIQDGMQVQIDYTLTVDGNTVDSSEGRGPLSYTPGQGQLIPGLERQLMGLRAGDMRELTVSPEDGYGAIDPEAFIEVPKAQLPPDVTPEVGMMLRGTNPDGQPFSATISKIGEQTVTLDLNHPLAGKTLHFNVKVVTVTTST